LADLSNPFYGYVFVSPLQTIEFISSLVADDGGVFGVTEACVGIHMGKEVLDVMLEVCDYFGVCVELHCVGREG
jgi:hypothetical protein